MACRLLLGLLGLFLALLLIFVLGHHDLPLLDIDLRHHEIAILIALTHLPWLLGDDGARLRLTLLFVLFGRLVPTALAIGGLVRLANLGD